MGLSNVLLTQLLLAIQFIHTASFSNIIRMNHGFADINIAASVLDAP